MQRGCVTQAAPGWLKEGLQGCRSLHQGRQARWQCCPAHAAQRGLRRDLGPAQQQRPQGLLPVVGKEVWKMWREVGGGLPEEGGWTETWAGLARKQT